MNDYPDVSQRGEFARELEKNTLQFVLALGKAVQAKDDYTAQHAAQLGDWVERVALKLGVSDADELRTLQFGAQLHDLGKIRVPDRLLNRPGPLDAEERLLMQQHPAIGGSILDSIPNLEGVAEIVRHHHERWDGTGYPDGLAGQRIPLGARIVAVVDTYSAILDRRVYKPRRPVMEAVLELRRGAGHQFDPYVICAFLETLEEDGIIVNTPCIPVSHARNPLTALREKSIWSLARFTL